MQVVPDQAPVLPEVPERWRNVVIGSTGRGPAVAAEMPAEIDHGNVATIVPSPPAAKVDAAGPNDEPFGPPEAPTPFRDAAE